MSNKDYQKFINLIENRHKNWNVKRTGLPVCQNQEYEKNISLFKLSATCVYVLFRYGWIWKPFTYLDAKERQKLIRPRCRAELSEFAEKLEEQKVTERPKFGGLTFKV